MNRDSRQQARRIETPTRPLNTPAARPPLLLIQTTVPETLRAFFKGQLRWLTGHGFQVNAVSSPGGALGDVERREGVAVHGVPMTRSITVLADLLSLWRLVRLYCRLRPAVVHGFTPKGGLLAMVAAWFVRRPRRAYTIFGLVHMSKRGMRRWLLRLTERVSCSLASVVFCECESIRDVAVAEGICPQGKIRVLPAWSLNTIGSELARTKETVASGELLRASLGLTQDALVIGFVGRVVRDKGVHELVGAYRSLGAQLPQLHLLLVGEVETEDPVSSEVWSQIVSDPHIHAVGFQSDVAPYLASMDLLVHPSYREGLPTAPLEAAAMALPVVATRIPGNIDAVLDQVTGTLVAPRDEKALAEAIRPYLVSPELRRRHGEAGRGMISRAFQKDMAWEQLLREYRRLAGAEGIRAPAGRQPHSPAAKARAGMRMAVKRFIDIAVSAVALLVMAPLLVVLATLIRIAMGSPVLFRQRRAGLHGRPFTLLKFRTMTDARGPEGRPLSDAERLTPIGSWLRRTSLDELPQFWNVLRGDMSLVGPRPLLTEYLPRYTAEQARRHDVKPGITGWAQVHGRNEVTWESKFELDVWYVDHRSLLLDAWILLMTVVKVLKRQGISQVGETTMGEFMGVVAPTESEPSTCQRL